MSPKARKTKAKINYWNYIKTKSCTANEIIDKKRTTYLMGEDICK